MPVPSVAALLSAVRRDATVVGIDEVQFFEHAIAPAAARLADEGVRVIVCGLDLDYRAEPFGPVPELLARADFVTKLQSICTECGAPAGRSQRLIAKEAQLFVGGASEYEARCRFCFRPEPT
jgi:thymidine kinase